MGFEYIFYEIYWAFLLIKEHMFQQLWPMLKLMGFSDIFYQI